MSTCVCVHRLGNICVRMCGYMSRCEYMCVCVCVYGQMHTYVYGCELTVGMYICMHFVLEPLTLVYKEIEASTKIPVFT